MKKTKLFYGAALISSFTVGNLWATNQYGPNSELSTLDVPTLYASTQQAPNQLTACNGKTYTVGDTLRLGKSNSIGYLFVKQLEEDGSLNIVNEERHGLELIISEIPAYDQKLYENMAILEKPEKPAIVRAENQTGIYYIYLDPALVYGNVMSVYKPSSIDGYKELTSAALYAYSMKLYGKSVDTESIDMYASLVDPEAHDHSELNPFEQEELRVTYKEKLHKAITEADFNQVFRLKCLSEVGTYNIDKEVLSIEGFHPSDVMTDQIDELSKLNYCLWGDCAFHFTNAADFTSIHCTKENAKSLYNLKEQAGDKYNKSIVLTSYVYVRFHNKPVQLPQTRVTVVKPGKSFDFDITTLDKAFGKKSLLMEIVHVDSYHEPATSDAVEEVNYNYVGSKTK